jgi:hypothetical protein
LTSKDASSNKKRPVKCFNCGEEHYISNCPEFLKFKKAKEDQDKHATATWDASTFVTYQFNAFGGSQDAQCVAGKSGGC